MSLHDFAGVESLGSKFATPKVPTWLHRHPTAMMQAPKINSMADIPTAVAVVVLHALRHWRIVVAIHTLDDAIRIFATHCLGSRIKKQLHVVTKHESVRLGAGSRKWLVDKRNKHAAGVRAHEAFHGGGLPHAFVELIAADRSKKREIGLQHQPQTVAGLVDLALDGMLSKSEKIQVGELGEQDVIVELLCVTSKNAQIKVPHRIRSTESNLSAVKQEFPFGCGSFILLESTHAELAAYGVEQLTISILE